MDCEKLDAMAVDLVYDELDARRAEEAEQHLIGCVRCSALVARLRDGLRAAAELPLDEPSALLESRILAAAGAARGAPSWPRRITRAISAAGSYAMRPQIAMAAVLLVMVGTSVLLLRGSRMSASRPTKVTEEGTPIATLEPPAPALDNSGAPAVIGNEKKPAAAAPAKPAEAQASVAPTATPKQALDEAESDGKNKKAEAPADKLAGGDKEESKEKAKDKESDKDDGADSKGLAAAGPKAKPAAGAGGAPASEPAPDPAPKAEAAKESPATAGKKSPTPTTPPAAPAPPPAPTAAPPSGGAAATSTAAPVATPATFDESMTAYKEGRYAAAAKGFDAAFAAGTKPSTSLLYAARSHRAAGSCTQALPRFQKVLASYATTAEAPSAALEGGQCAKQNGDIPTARSLFERAKSWPATKARAEAELAALDKPPAAAKPPAKSKAADSSKVDSAY